MNKPYCAPHNASHLINRDPSVVGKPPPPLLNSSTYKSLKDNFISYSVASTAKDIVPRGFLLPHNKADVGLKAVASDSNGILFNLNRILFDSQADPFDSKSMDYDSKSMDYDSKSMDYDSKSMDYDSKSMDYDSKSTDYDLKSMDFDLKSMDFDLKSKPFILRDKHAILPCEAQSLQEGIPIEYKEGKERIMVSCRRSCFPVNR
jgi:hypothetical protein